MLSQAEANQLKSPEFAVSENINDESSPLLEDIIENDTEGPQIQQLENNLNQNNGLIKVTIDSLQNHKATEGSLIKIKGTSIHDSDNGKLSFTWKQMGGQPIDPEDARLTSQTVASEIAPQIEENTTNLIFEVTVPEVNTNDNDKLSFEIIAQDDNGNSASDSVDIFVDNNPEFLGTDNIQNNPNVLESITNEQRNVTNQLLPSEFTAANNITNRPSYLPNVLENDSETSNIDIQDKDIQSMFEILIEDLK